MFLLQIALGALAGVAVVAAARRLLGESPRFYGLALVIAALILLAFAFLNGSGRDIGLEVVGTALFAFLAWRGQSRPILIAAGWLAHVPWDILLHSPGPTGHVPAWYLYVCVGFDLLLGGYVLFRYRSRAGGRRLERRERRGGTQSTQRMRS